MSLYESTFHFIPVDLSIILECKLYISCIMSWGDKIVSELLQIVSNVLEMRCLKSLIGLSCLCQLKNDEVH